MTALVKQPSESLLYSLPVGDIGVAEISAVTGLVAVARGLVPEVTPLTVEAPTFSGNIVQFRALGGTDGELYLIQVMVSTSTGGALEAEGELRVLDLAWTLPGDPGGSYVSPQGYVDRFGIDELVRLSDEDGVGRVNKGALYAALSDATAEVDAYLTKRYLTPLLPVPALITQLSADVARYKLHADHALDQVVTRYRDAIRTLERLAQGLAVLPGAAAAAGGGSGTPVYKAANATFSRDTLEGF